MDLETYMRWMRDHAGGELSLFGYLLEHGRKYPPQALTEEERAVVQKAAKLFGDDFQLRECFYNAQMLVRYDFTNQLRYVEGVANKMIPVLHGWATINGKVIDLTWRHDNDERIWGDNYKWEYWGVEIPKEYVAMIHAKYKAAKSLLDDPESDWLLLRKQAPEMGGVG